MESILPTLFPMAHLLVCTLIFEFVLMSGVWYMAMKRKNAAFVDLAWSGSFGMIALFYAVASSGAPIRRCVIAAMVCCWSFRLAFHLWNRIKREKHEDKRYAEMRAQWGKKAESNFFAMFQFQAITVIVLSLPFLVGASDSYEHLRINEYVGILLFIGCLIGEATADRQLEEFKAKQTNEGKVCDVGLWHYSRHPNYFFEWMTWCAYYIYVVSSPFGTYMLIAPVIMLLFLTKMSGIPIAEKQSLASKGEKYVEYQKRTSPFIPWLSKKS